MSNTTQKQFFYAKLPLLTLNDMFFHNHSIYIWGRIPGDIEMLWSQKNVDDLPTSILIDTPHVVKNDFDVKFVIENKINRVVLYESQPLHLNLHSMNNQFKIVDLERSK